MDRGIAAKFIYGLFKPSDRLAVVVLNKRTGTVTQRITTAERMAGPGIQAWLRHENAQKREVYLSMNVLKPDARGRTKEDVGTIRHIYLDFDKNGSAALHALFKHPDIPEPSLIMNTSPDKWQVIWQVEGFTNDAAEGLQRRLARDTGADPAATDCARVLRLPGFYNHKYDRPYLVRAEAHAALEGTIYRPEEFPDFSHYRPPGVGRPTYESPSNRSGSLSQSERDWAFAKRALSRGLPIDSIIAAIADYRRNEKSDPEYYATHTVQKAASELAHEQQLDLDLPTGPER